MPHRFSAWIAVVVQIACLVGCTVVPAGDDPPAAGAPLAPPVPGDDEDGGGPPLSRPDWTVWEDAANVQGGTAFHCDPARGDLANPGTAAEPWPGLQAVVEAGFVQRWTAAEHPVPPDGVDVVVCENPDAPVAPGDRLILHDGDHGEVQLRDLHQPAFLALVAAEGAQPQLRRLSLLGVERLVIDGLTLRGERGEERDGSDHDRLLSITDHSWNGPSGQVLVRNCTLESSLDVQDWSAADWVARSCDGVVIKADRVSLHGNRIAGVRHGVIALGREIAVCGTVIDRFCGDGIQVIGSDHEVTDNVIRDSYKVDDNHDDGIQVFPFRPGETCARLTIHRNLVLGHTDPDRALTGALNGIGLFSGGYREVSIVNNLLVVDQWNGIIVRGGEQVRVVNNTLLDIDPDGGLGPPIIVVDDGPGGASSRACLVRNNIAQDVVVVGDSVADHNLTHFAIDEVFVAAAAGDYRPRSGGPAVDAGTPDGAPATDLERRARPRGAGIDLGAVER